VKQRGAPVLVRAGPLESLTLQRRPTTTLGLDWSWEFSLYKQCSFHLVPHFEFKGRVITSGMSSIVLQKSS
jgi:hypothetical protein